MKENQRIAVTKRMLKEGLLRLLKTEELKKIRICQLCEEAGVNRATFYRHYETVQDVLFELERDIALQMLPKGGVPTEPSQIRHRLEELFTFVKENAEVIRILIRCSAEGDMKRRFNEFYRVYVLQRIEEQREPKLDPAAAKSIVAFLAGGLYSLLRQWVEDGMPDPPGKLAAVAVSLIRLPVIEEMSFGEERSV